VELSILYADFGPLERDLHLPAGFLEGLVEEDDWSFVIKAHAVVEAALTHLLSSSTDSRLSAVFRRLPFAGGEASKLGAGTSLELIDELSRDLARRLAELRNLLVHNVSHLSFALEPHFFQMPDTDRRAFGDAIAKAVAGPEWRTFTAMAKEGISNYPKLTLFYGVLGILARAIFHLDPSEYERASQKAKEGSPAIALFLLIVFLVAAASKGALPGQSLNRSRT
jgi:hypothetical protein